MTGHHFLNISGRVPLKELLDDLDVDDSPMMSAFDALVINALQSLLSSVATLQDEVAALKARR